jgi:hypothetical protein
MQLERPVTMLCIAEPDGTPVATAGCLSAAAEIMRHALPGWYYVFDSPRVPRPSCRAPRRWGSALRHVDGRVIMIPDPLPARSTPFDAARPAALR